MLFSIIVPCYNVSRYLEKCIESVLHQKLQDWEMILIDDGSTDNTSEIINYYNGKDKRIKKIYQKNMGLSAARNRGIKEAAGKYILFLDADDWYKNEQCLDKIAIGAKKDVDIIVFQLDKITESGRCCHVENNLQFFPDYERIYTSKEYLETVLSKNDVYEWFPVLYAYRKTLFEKEMFDESIRFFEDVDFVYRIILKAEKLFVIKDSIYQYRIGRDGQLTHVSKELIKNRISVTKKNIKLVNVTIVNKKMKKLLNGNFVRGYFWSIIMINYLEEKEQKEILLLLKKNKCLMKYALNKKDRFAKILINVLGVFITAKLLFVRSKFREKINLVHIP